MGFLDKTQRILDATLTEYGRQQYALGKLRFVNFSLHDDLVDYDPFILSSGSYAEEQLSSLRELIIEMTPTLEVPSIPMRTVSSTGKSALIPDQTIFSAASGYDILPAASISPTGSFISAKQHVIDGRYRRSDMTEPVVHLDHVGDLKAEDRWYLVKVLSSSSDGYREIPERYDSSDELSYGPFVIIRTDR